MTPIFESMTAALRFAHAYSATPKSPLGGLGGTKRNFSENGFLGGLDGAAQAGMILRRLQDMDALERAALAAVFETSNFNRHGAIYSLADWVRPQLGGRPVAQDLAVALVWRWLHPHQVKLASMADDFNLHGNTVGARSREANALLWPLYHQAVLSAWRVLDGALFSAG